MLAVETPHGRANVHLHSSGGASAALVLGHGAGGGMESGDLVAGTVSGRSISWYTPPIPVS